MASHSTSAALLSARLNTLRLENGGRIGMEDVAAVVQEVVSDEQGSAPEPELSRQLEEISDAIRGIRGDTFCILQEGKVPESTEQLDAVLESTEVAANTIMDAAQAIEAIMQEAGDAADAQARILEHIMNIYQACSFQDIGGQRIKKVLRNLSAIEARLRSLAALIKGDGTPVSGRVAQPQSEEDALLAGPALPDGAPSQEDIDKLFSSL